MNIIKCLNLNHKDDGAAVCTVYCIDCGKKVGPNITPNPLCEEHHQEYKNFKHRFCPDCGIPLLNLKRGLNQDGRTIVLNAVNSQDDLTDIPDVIKDALFKQKGLDPTKNLEFIRQLELMGCYQTALMLKQIMIAA